MEYKFDDELINWQQLPDFNNFYYYILNIDRSSLIIDVIFKFLPFNPIVLHRHCATNHTFVIQGEHRLYYPDGRLKESRSVGSYTVGQPDEQPHRESGGEDGCVVLFSIRGTDGGMYEILDDEQTLIATFDMATFETLYQLQQESK